MIEKFIKLFESLVKIKAHQSALMGVRAAKNMMIRNDVLYPDDVFAPLSIGYKLRQVDGCEANKNGQALIGLGQRLVSVFL